MQDRISVNTPAGNNALQFWTLSGRESLSQPFALDVCLLSSDPLLDRKALLGQPITVAIPGQQIIAKPRYLNGKITGVKVRSVELEGSRYAAYTLKMESDLWPLLRDRDQRIFQNQRVPDIIKTVLSEHGVNVEDALTGDYRNWEYCVQYQESSFNFISRLMELEGIYFYFRHEADRHILVLADAASVHRPFSGYEVIPYHVSASGGSTREQGIGNWTISECVTPGLYSIDDYDFRKPNAWLLQAQQNPASPLPGEIDYYEWPGRFVDHAHGEFYARIRQQAWQAEHQQIDANGTALGIAPGHTFTLGNPPFAAGSAAYQVISADYQLEENSYASGGNDSLHNIDFTVIPADVTFRAAQETAWPRTHGPQTARVVGPQGESIWTDKYGRIKVKFHWDRLAKGDDTSSCWVRVSSAWAGQGFGGVQIPRVGDEVVVDFINGDPDRPIVTGRVYNDASMPPWALPAAATQMGFMTRSKNGNHDNASHLLFEDTLGAEMVHIHAEKDMAISVESDKAVTIDGNRTTTIKKQQTDDVTGDGTFHYHANRTTTVEETEIRYFNNSETTTITNGRTLNIVSGGDTATIVGEKNTTIDGKELHHTTGKVTQTYDAGLETLIGAAGKTESITGPVKVDVYGGDWTQKIHAGKLFFKASQSIHLKSATKIIIEAPEIEHRDQKKTRDSNQVVEFLKDSLSTKLLSVSFTGLSASVTDASYSAAGITYSSTAFNLNTKEGRIDFIATCRIVGSALNIDTSRLHMKM